MAHYQQDEDDNFRRRYSGIRNSVGRAPLQDLNVLSGFDEDATTTTTSTANFATATRKRVSFNNKFNIKEFNAEDRTVHVMHAPEYEEPLWMSSDSSCCRTNNSSTNLSQTEVIDCAKIRRSETVKVYYDDTQSVAREIVQESCSSKTVSRKSIGSVTTNVDMETTSCELMEESVISSPENAGDEMNNSSMEIDETNVNVHNILSSSSQMVYADDENESFDKSAKFMTKAIPQVMNFGKIDDTNNSMSQTKSIPDKILNITKGRPSEDKFSNFNITTDLTSMSFDTTNASTRNLSDNVNDESSMVVTKALSALVCKEINNLSIPRSRHSLVNNNCSNLNTRDISMATDSCNMSVTKALPAIVNESNNMGIQRNHLPFMNNNGSNLNITRNVSVAMVDNTSNMITSKGLLATSNEDSGNMSITRAIRNPSGEHNSTKNLSTRNVSNVNDTYNISKTKGLTCMSFDTNSMNMTRGLETQNNNYASECKDVSQAGTDIPSNTSAMQMSFEDNTESIKMTNTGLHSEPSTKYTEDLSIEECNKDRGSSNNRSVVNSGRLAALQSENNDHGLQPNCTKNEIINEPQNTTKNIDIRTIQSAEDNVNENSSPSSTRPVNLTHLHTFIEDNVNPNMDLTSVFNRTRAKRSSWVPLDLTKAKENNGNCTELYDESCSFMEDDTLEEVELYVNGSYKGVHSSTRNLAHGSSEHEQDTNKGVELTSQDNDMLMDISEIETGKVTGEKYEHVASNINVSVYTDLNMSEVSVVNNKETCDINMSVHVDDGVPKSNDEVSPVKETEVQNENKKVEELHNDGEDLVKDDGDKENLTLGKRNDLTVNELMDSSVDKLRDGHVSLEKSSIIDNQSSSNGSINCSLNENSVQNTDGTGEVPIDLSHFDFSRITVRNQNRQTKSDKNVTPFVPPTGNSETVNELVDDINKMSVSPVRVSEMPVKRKSLESDIKDSNDLEQRAKVQKCNDSDVTFSSQPVQVDSFRALNQTDNTHCNVDLALENTGTTFTEHILKGEQKCSDSDVTFSSQPVQVDSFRALNQTDNTHCNLDLALESTGTTFTEHILKGEQKCSDSDVTFSSQPVQVDSFRALNQTDNTHYNVDLALEITGTTFTEQRLKDFVDPESECISNRQINMIVDDVPQNIEIDKEAYYNHLIQVKKSKMVFTTEFRSHSCCCAFKILPDNLFEWKFFENFLILSAKLNDKDKQVVEKTMLTSFDDIRDPSGGCLILFAKKVKDKFINNASNCKTPNDVSNLLMDIIKHIEKNDIFFNTIMEFFSRHPISFIGEDRLKYDLVSASHFWCEIIMDSSIMWRKLSDQKISVNNIIGRVNFGMVQHILRLSSYSNNHLMNFVKMLEEHERNNVDKLIEDET